jgi:dienelactone hydrolase
MYRLLLSLFLCLLALPAFAAGKNINYQVSGKTYQGYFISPSAEAPLLLMVHDWDGLTDYEMKRSEMLSEAGYAVFAVDMYGQGIRPTELAEKKRLSGELYGDRQKMRRLLDGAMQKASELGNLQNAVAMGYCFGGSVVLELARSGIDLQGFVSFHGGLATPEGQDYSATKGSLLVLHGSADQAVPFDQFAALAKQLEEQAVPHEMITYSGAPHAFTVFGSPRYREDADRKSWNRFLSYLDTTLN